MPSNYRLGLAPMIKKTVFIVLMLSVLFSSINVMAKAIISLPGIAKKTMLYQDSGYAHGIFYWYSSATTKKNNALPIILWTSGGPGSSSLYGFFVENGPFTCAPTKKGHPHLSMATTHANWSSFANLLILDQPLGVGLSFTQSQHYPHSPKEGNRQYYSALQHFFAQHPNLRNHDLYLAGESYGATYIALLAQRIEQEHDPHKKLRLKGMISISGWVAPTRQYNGMAEYAYAHGLLNHEEKRHVQALNLNCQYCDNQKQDCNAVCSKIYDAIQNDSGGLNLHNISMLGQDDWQQAGWIKCLNQHANRFRQDIHVPSTAKYSPMTNIWDAYGKQQEDSVLPIYKQLMTTDRLKLLIISGLNDASPCGPVGTKHWLSVLYPHIGDDTKQCWVKAMNTDKPPIVLGYHRILSKRVTWLTVRNAGHAVPIDQPIIAEIINHFVTQSPLNSTALQPCYH